MSTVCTARASYKKSQGLLELTSTHLQWTQDRKELPAVHVAHTEVSSLFSSKEGAAQQWPQFHFHFPPPLALTERETFKAQLTTIISNNRAVRETGVLQPPQTSIQAATPSSNDTTHRAPLPTPSRPSTSRAESVSSNQGTPANDPINDFHLRKKVLVKTPELAVLHRELVRTGHITETEFWEGREHLLLAQAASDSQKKGRPGQLVDPRPQAVEGGEVKIVITPQLVHDIFDEYPVVAKAYDENVPGKLSEAEFWKRYFQSKLFHSHRASIRSTATQHVVKDDTIFDKYLEKPDDELEPRKPRDDDVDMFIDLEATREDHEETGNENDVTMQAGKQRGALPLIRKFNEHSERLLKSAISTDGTGKRRKVDTGDSHGYYSQIDLADLHNLESPAGILLEMQDRQRYFEARAGAAASVEQAPRPAVDFPAALLQMRRDLEGWQVHLAQLKTERKATEAALVSMTQNVATRLDVHKRKADIPEEIFRQMRTCQMAANEFLRQFWSVIYPPIGETVGGPSTLAQRTAKAARMAGYLTKTPEKVMAIVNAAETAGLDRGRVQTGMQPTLDAVNKALEFWETRKAAPGSGAPGARRP
ncbi:hypothetical protein B0F90DRAFT_1698089 [Multifurca ochricompacta]|uniref:BSD domain-containing protein n=1 Tax=Multifurca ochricompacta TaxID=376703 RepID=A0AAD4QQR3_9AGAM|nr:hypothetical protein B0F90DRAFT_1698089 [Multifurca ochricompacta]